MSSGPWLWPHQECCPAHGLPSVPWHFALKSIFAIGLGLRFIPINDWVQPRYYRGRDLLVGDPGLLRWLYPVDIPAACGRQLNQLISQVRLVADLQGPAFSAFPSSPFTQASLLANSSLTLLLGAPELTHGFWLLHHPLSYFCSFP